MEKFAKIEFGRDWSVGLDHWCTNHDTEGKRFKFPHPLLWRNEASLLDQWRTMYFPLALFAYTVCCRRTGQCFSVLRTHKSDAAHGSSGRRYVTDQWHNVPLLRTRGLDASLGDGHTEKLIFFSSFRDFSRISRKCHVLGLECTVNPQNLINFVGAIFEKIENFINFFMWTTLNFRGREKPKKLLEIFTKGP